MVVMLCLFTLQEGAHVQTGHAVPRWDWVDAVRRGVRSSAKALEYFSKLSFLARRVLFGLGF